MKLREFLAVLNSEIDVVISNGSGITLAKNACYSEVLDYLDNYVTAIMQDNETLYISIDFKYEGEE